MKPEAVGVYAAATEATTAILATWIDFANTMLEGPERDEVRFHIEAMAISYERLTLAIQDYEGLEL